MGYLVHLSEGMCTTSRVMFSPPFSNDGYQKKAIFAKASCQKCYFIVFPMNFLHFGVILFAKKLVIIYFLHFTF